ncbi:MAG: glycosyltransferase [Nitrososphaerota archaeon]
MKALIIDDLRRKGGGQSYARNMAVALMDIGYKVYFLTNVNDINGIYGQTAFYVNYEFKESSSRIKDLLKILRLKRELGKINISDFDLTINNHPNVFIKRADMHILHGFSFLDPWIDKDGNVVNSAPQYFFRLSRFYKIYEDSLFIPNSFYTKRISEKLFPKLNLNVNIGNVLYPPVIVNNPVISEKKKQVLIIGRINRNKGIEDAINILGNKSFKVIIAGYVNKGDEKYVENVKRYLPSNIDIRKNISDEEKWTLMEESSTILSLNQKEHFGIATAEAMMYGCVPVVPKSGGQWEDIISMGEYGLGYSSFDEVVDLLNESFKYDYRERERISKYSARFSLEQFKRNLSGIVDAITSRM